MTTHRRGVALLAGMLVTAGGTAAAAAPADVCLEVAPGSVSSDQWAAVAVAVTAATEPKTTLFPAPTVRIVGSRLDVDSGHDGLTVGQEACLREGYEWTTRFGSEWLEASADQMLAEADKTPGIESDVSIEWYPDENRVRTTLVFAGPLDIPNGTCWVDDVLTVDVDGVVVASGDEGLKTSPFAEAACGRFFDNLPLGGAGEQAVTLLPRSVDLADGSQLHFVAEDVLVASDALSVSGRLARN